MSKKNKKSNKSEDISEEYFELNRLEIDNDDKHVRLRRKKLRQNGLHSQSFSIKPECNNCTDKRRRIKVRDKPNGTGGEIHIVSTKNTDDE